MAHVTGTDLYDLLYDVLVSNTSSNPQMTGNVVPLLNKKFNTTDKRTVGAINELLTKVTNVSTGFNSFTGDYNNIMGDFKANSQLQTDLEKVDANLILSLLKIYKELHGEDLDNQIPLPEGKTVAELLNSLNVIIEKTFEVIEPITQYQLVGMDENSRIYPISADNELHMNSFLGISLESKNVGEQCNIKTFGEITNDSWMLSTGSIYVVGLNGQLAVSNSASNFSFFQQIGKAKDSKTLILLPQYSIKL